MPSSPKQNGVDQTLQTPSIKHLQKATEHSIIRLAGACQSLSAQTNQLCSDTPVRPIKPNVIHFNSAK